jgi:hypothetical protein
MNLVCCVQNNIASRLTRSNVDPAVLRRTRWILLYSALTGSLRTEQLQALWDYSRTHARQFIANTAMAAAHSGSSSSSSSNAGSSSTGGGVAGGANSSAGSAVGGGGGGSALGATVQQSAQEATRGRGSYRSLMAVDLLIALLQWMTAPQR